MKKLLSFLFLLVGLSCYAAPVTNSYTLITVGSAASLITNITTLTTEDFYSQSSTQSYAVLNNPSLTFSVGSYDAVTNTNWFVSFAGGTPDDAWAWIEITNFVCLQYSTNRAAGRSRIMFLQNNSGTNQDLSWNASWKNVTCTALPAVLTNATSAMIELFTVGGDETNVFIKCFLGNN